MDALLERAREQVAAGRWSDAAESFKAALERREDPEARFGLGVALWWLGETEVSLRHWERAYVAFRRRRNPARAVLAAVYLCLAYRMTFGNDAASRGWLARAARVAGDDDPALKGWVLVCRAHLAIDGGRPHAGEAWAREALDLGQAVGDADMEMCAASEVGAALIELGRLDEGASLLDEAMAAALGGEGRDLDAVVMVSCRTITACSRGGDVRRATQWVRAAEDFHQRYGSTHLFTTCRTHYGGILFATGDWDGAEQELSRALAIGRSAEPALHAEALAKLAEVRLAQGRTDEAARLLAGYEDHPSTLAPMAMIHLARGAPRVAAALLRRRLRDIDDGCLESATLTESLAEAEIVQVPPTPRSRS